MLNPMNNTYYKVKINGKDIFCAFTKGSTKKLVIMCHGFRGSSLGPNRTFFDFTQLLVPKGYSVLRFDQPNSGNSEGNFIDSSFNEWITTITYLTKHYLEQEYEIALLGQSMGATAVVAIMSDSQIRNKVKCLLLWVPDPKSTFDKDPNQIYEEGGQKYKGSFWQEAKESNFFDCLQIYTGKIHLIYGERDMYVDEKLRKRVIEQVKSQGGKG